MIYGNLPPASSNNTTTTFFDNFFTAGGAGTSSNVNDAVIGYFQSITGDAESGVTLAASVLSTAASQGIPAMELIDQFRQLSNRNKNNFTYPQWQPNVTYTAGITVIYQNQYFVATQTIPAATTFSTTGWKILGNIQSNQGISELDAYLTMFLNINRVGTSLLGLSNSPQTSPYVTRAILP